MGMSQDEIQINDVLPWGRSLAEYQAMFALTDADLECSILSCADGPASFNAEMTAGGHPITSVDPVIPIQCRKNLEPHRADAGFAHREYAREPGRLHLGSHSRY
ncbi:MAG: hypothetical protein VCD00_16245 [Candidatus Hydrogenedentota bacterium]